MKIIIGSDHKGYQEKEQIIKYLKHLQFEVEDVGTNNEESTDYPIYAAEVCKKVLLNPMNVGILICGTGIGMSIAANKFKGIRCAKIDNELDAKYSRLHNNANIAAFPSRINIEELKRLIYIFIKTPFSFEERHIRRIKEIETFES